MDISRREPLMVNSPADAELIDLAPALQNRLKMKVSHYSFLKICLLGTSTDIHGEVGNSFA